MSGSGRARNPLSVFLVLWHHRFLVGRLALREVLQRYRGSTFGLLWSLFHPLLMLCVFTFVFGHVIQAKWGREVEDTAEFGLVLFCGLIVFWMLSECLGRSPRLVLEHATFVKRVVFPLEVLPWVVVATALFHAAVSAVVLLVAVWAVQGSLPWTALLFPLVLLPVALLGLGACWFFSALGVYVRDLQQVMPVLVTALLFLTPIFYPPEAVPEALRVLLGLNPLAPAVEQARAVLLFGTLPDAGRLLGMLAGAWAVAWLGLGWFVRARRGFADVV